MEILFLSIIVLVMSLSLMLNILPAHATPDAFFMQTNSIGKIYANYTRDNFENNDMKVYSMIYPYPPLSNSGLPIDPKIISLSVQPNSLINHQTTPVTFVITASNDSKGVYQITFGICGHYYLLVVGMNESEVDPRIIHYYLEPHVEMGCIGNTSLFSQEMYITGYSNITPKMLYENWNMKNGIDDSNSSQISQAIDLAKSSSQFQSLVKGQNYTFASDFNYLKYNKVAYIVVVFALENGKTIEVFEDPSIYQVTNVTEFAPIGHTSPPFSTTPEFPFAIPILIISIASLIIIRRVVIK